MAEIQALVKLLEVTEIVVGLPIQLDGTEGPAVAEARGFGAQVALATGLPVGYVDERLTTKQAERALVGQGISREGRRQVGDRVAAALLLQGVLAGSRARP
jgi:putative Holliday junction resolvase